MSARQANRSVIEASGFRGTESAYLEDLAEFRSRDPWSRLLVLVPSRHVRDRLREAVVRAGVSGFQLDIRLVAGLSEAILAETGDVPAPADDGAALLVRFLAGRLDDQPGSRFATVARRGGFHESLLASFKDLDEAGPDLARLEAMIPSAAPRLSEPLTLYLEWRRRLEALGLATTAQRVALAAGRAGAFRPGEPVWLYGFYDLTGTQRRLIEALGQARAMRAYLPLFGGMSETYARPTRAWFAAWGAVETRAVAATPPETIAWFDAAGERREVEEVARRIRKLVAEGVRPGRVAVVSRHTRPYADLVREVFGRAGLVLAPSDGEPLLASPAGRGARLFLALAEREPSRRNVVDFLDVSMAGTDAVGVAALDQFSRDAGVTRGEASWRRGMDRAARHGDDARRMVETFRPALEELFAALAEFRRARTFAAMAASLGAVVERWFADDPNARAVRAEAESMATLDRLGVPPDPASFGWLLERRLESAGSLPRHDREGIVAGDVLSVRGLAFDQVFLLGMTERVFPGPVLPDPILLDADRARLAGAVEWLPLKGSAADEEKLLFELLWGMAPARTLSWSRLDPATGRPSIASSFLLEAAARRLGRPAGFADLEDHGRRIPMDQLSEAREAGRRQVDAVVPDAGPDGDLIRDALDEPEFAQMLVMAAVGADRPERAAFLRADVGFDRRLEAAADRWRPTFTSRDGALADPDALAILRRRWSPEHTWSASELEQCAGCPMRFFLERVLGLGERETPEDAERMPYQDRGALIHEVLREFLAVEGARLAAARGVGDPAVRATLVERLQDVTLPRLDAYEASGLIGHSLLWRLERERIRLDLVDWLDFELGRSDGLVPRAFELRFGGGPRPGRAEDPGSTLEPALIARPDGGQERLSGYIDRVDRAPDGSRARVVDYKTGRPSKPSKDPLDGGRRLQLAVYRLGLAVLGGAPSRVDAEYLHLGNDVTSIELADPVARGLETRLAADVAILADAIRSGFLPAWPADAPGGRCRCAYPSVCGVQRGELFEKKKGDPRFARLAALDGAPGNEGDA